MKPIGVIHFPFNSDYSLVLRIDLKVYFKKRF